MYVNPFERMRKKREDEEKNKVEVEKEREKYARLSAQMGFTQDKGVIPSFIKSLIGDKNSASAPPFGAGMTTPPTPENFVTSSPSPVPSQNFEQSQPSAPQPTMVASNQATPSAPWMTETNNLQQGFVSPSAAPQPSFEQPTMVAPNQSTPSAPRMTGNSSVQLEAPAPMNFTPKPVGVQTPKPTMPAPSSPLNGMNFTTPEPSEAPKTEIKTEVKPAVVEQKVKTKQINPGAPQLTVVELIEKINANELEGSVYGIIENSNEDIFEQVIDLLPKNQQVIVEVQEIFQYTSPELILLREIIKQLPLISLEDKRVLWEKSSLCLSATEYGKTGSELDDMIEEVGIADPIKLIVDEFMIAFAAYGLNKIITPVIIKNLKKIELAEMIPVLQFIYEVFAQIKPLKFLLQFNEQLMHNVKQFEMVNNLVMKVDGFVVDKVEELTWVDDEEFDETATQDFFGLEEENFENYDELDSFLDLNETQTMVNPFEQEFVAPATNTMQFEQPTHFEAPTNPAQVAQPVQQAPMNSFTRPATLADEGNFMSEAHFDPIGAMHMSGYSTDANSHQPTQNDYQENFHPLPSQTITASGLSDKKTLFGNDIRISVNLNLQRQADEMLRRERIEEQERLDKIMDVGFNPEILADEVPHEAEFHPHENSFQAQQTRFGGGATYGRSTKEVDPRSQQEIENRLKQLNNNLSQRADINIQNNFVKQDKSKQNANVIKVPGHNWSELK